MLCDIDTVFMLSFSDAKPCAIVCIQTCTGSKVTCVKRPFCSSIHCHSTSMSPASYDHTLIIHTFHIYLLIYITPSTRVNQLVLNFLSEPVHILSGRTKTFQTENFSYSAMFSLAVPFLTSIIVEHCIQSLSFLCSKCSSKPLNLPPAFLFLHQQFYLLCRKMFYVCFIYFCVCTI